MFNQSSVLDEHYIVQVGACLLTVPEMNCSVLSGTLNLYTTTTLTGQTDCDYYYLSHWNPYAVSRGSCPEFYYCKMVEWFWWDSSTQQ